MDCRTSWDYKKIDGFQSMHFVASVSNLNNTLLNVRDLTCFCLECMDDNSNFYNTQTHLISWKLLTLEPFNIVHVSRFNFNICY